MEEVRENIVEVEEQEREATSSGVGAAPKRKRRSIAWDRFNIISESLNGTSVEFANCKYCATKYRYSSNGSTGNLINHVKKKHPNILLTAAGSAEENN